MKNTMFLSVFALLLCGGLFCLHLTAQPERAGNASPVVSLLEMNFDEVSERQLLEMKVDAYQKLLDQAISDFEFNIPSGTATRLTEARANLAVAEIELRRYTGERDKLFAAQQARVHALIDKLSHVNSGIDLGVFPSAKLWETEIELLDALLEQKRASAE